MSETARKRDVTPEPAEKKESDGAERAEKAVGEKEPSEHGESRLGKWFKGLFDSGEEEKEKAKQEITDVKEGKVGAEGKVDLTQEEKKEVSDLEAQLEKAAGRIVRKRLSGSINEQIRVLQGIDTTLNQVKASEQVLELYGKLVKRGSVQSSTTGKYSGVSEAEQKILSDFEGPIISKEILSGMAKGELPWTINGVFLAIRELNSGFSPETGKDITASVLDISTGKKVNRGLKTAAKVAGVAAGVIGLAALNEHFGHKGEKNAAAEAAEAEKNENAELQRAEDAIAIEAYAKKIEEMRNGLAKALEQMRDQETKADYEAEHLQEETDRFKAMLPQAGENDPQARVNLLWSVLREFSNLEHDGLKEDASGKVLSPEEYFNVIFRPFVKGQLENITIEQQRDALEKLLHDAIAEMERRHDAADDKAREAQAAALELEAQLKECERLAKEAADREPRRKNLETNLEEVAKYQKSVREKIKEIKAANLESYRRGPDEKDDAARTAKLEKLLKRFSKNALASEPEGELSMKNLGEGKYFEHFVDEYRKLEDKDRLAFLEKHLIIAQGELAAEEEKLRAITETRERMLANLTELRAELPATPEEVDELSKALFREKTIDLLNSKKTRIASAELYNKPEIKEALADRIMDELSQGEFRAAELLAKHFKMSKNTLRIPGLAVAAQTGVIKRLEQGDKTRLREMLAFPHFTDETLQDESVQEAVIKYVNAHKSEPEAELISARFGIRTVEENEVDDDEDTVAAPSPFEETDGHKDDAETEEEEKQDEETPADEHASSGEFDEVDIDKLSPEERARMLEETKAFLSKLPKGEGVQSATPPNEDAPPEPDEVNDDEAFEAKDQHEAAEMIAAEKATFMGDVQTLIHEKITYATNKPALDRLPQARNDRDRRMVLGKFGVAPDRLAKADEQTVAEAYELFSSSVKARSRELATGDDIENSVTDTGEREHDTGDADDFDRNPPPDAEPAPAGPEPEPIDPEEVEALRSAAMESARDVINVEKRKLGTSDAKRLERRLEKIKELTTPDAMRANLERFEYLLPEQSARLSNEEIAVLHRELVAMTEAALATARTAETADTKGKTENKEITPERIFQIVEGAINEDISKGKTAVDKVTDIGTVRKIISTAFASLQDIKKTIGQGDAKAVNVLTAEEFSFRPTLEKLPAGQPEKLLQEYQLGLEAILEAARVKEKEIIVADAKNEITKEAPSRLEGRDREDLEDTLRVIKTSHAGRTVTNLSESGYITRDDLRRLSEAQILELRDTLAKTYETAIAKKETSKNEEVEKPEPTTSGETQEITRERAITKLNEGIDEMKARFDEFIERDILTQPMLEQNLSSLRQTGNVVGLLESSIEGSSYRQYADALSAADTASVLEQADRAVQAAIRKAAERAVTEVENKTEKVKAKKITELNRRIQSEMNPSPAIVIPKDVSPAAFAEIEKCVKDYAAKKDPKKIDDIRTWLETK